MRKRQNHGIVALLDIAKINTPVQTYHLGYVLGPRINSGGRVGAGYLGTEILSTESYDRAYEIGLKLEKLNNERKAIEAIITNNIINDLEKEDVESMPYILCVGDDWHMGLLGIIASKIKDMYKKPTIVVSIQGDGYAKGSARSIRGIDIGQVIANAKHSGILVEGGGHPMAGGLKLEVKKIEAFKNYLNKTFSTQFQDLDYKNYIDIEITISIDGVRPNLIDEIEKAAPFGPHNPQPYTMLQNVKISSFKVINKAHIFVEFVDSLQDD